MKRLLLHDISSFHFEGILGSVPDDVRLMGTNPPVAHCVGCFGCWVKTPGQCVIDDRGRAFALELMETDELIIVSRLYCGGFSPDVKAFMDRGIPSILPFFEVRGERSRHPRRVDRPLRLRCYFYRDTGNVPDSGLITDGSDQRPLMEVAEDLEGRNARGAMASQEVPSETELSAMRKVTESNAGNLGASLEDVRFLGDMQSLQALRL
jgi:hypothetical protein